MQRFRKAAAASQEAGGGLGAWRMQRVVVHRKQHLQQWSRAWQRTSPTYVYTTTVLLQAAFVTLQFSSTSLYSMGSSAPAAAL